MVCFKFTPILRLTASCSCGFQTELALSTSKHWRLIFSLDADSFEKEVFFTGSCKKTAPIDVGINFLGLWISLYWGDGRHDGYDEHLDKYYDFEPLEKAYPDFTFRQLDALIPYSRCRPFRFKEFYCSDRLKVYANNMDNSPNACAVEAALPFFRYIKASYKKPLSYGSWIGMELWINASAGIKLSLIKRDLKILIGKNRLNRVSNLATEKAINRFFCLKGNRVLTEKEIVSAFSLIDNYLDSESASTALRMFKEKMISPTIYIKYNPYVFCEADKKIADLYYSFLNDAPVDNELWEKIEETYDDLPSATVERLQKIKESISL